MKYLVTVIIISLLLYCTSNKQPDIEARAKQFMQDSVVPLFNDPASYQFVSLKVDTFTGSDYLKNLHRLYIDTDTSILLAGQYQEKKSEIAKLSSVPGYADSVLHLNIEIEYRGKNKLGGLVLDRAELRYLPNADKIITVQ